MDDGMTIKEVYDNMDEAKTDALTEIVNAIIFGKKINLLTYIVFNAFTENEKTLLYFLIDEFNKEYGKKGGD